LGARKEKNGGPGGRKISNGFHKWGVLKGKGRGEGRVKGGGETEGKKILGAGILFKKLRGRGRKEVIYGMTQRFPSLPRNEGKKDRGGQVEEGQGKKASQGLVISGFPVLGKRAKLCASAVGRFYCGQKGLKLKRFAWGRSGAVPEYQENKRGKERAFRGRRNPDKNPDEPRICKVRLKQTRGRGVSERGREKYVEQ